MANLHAVGDELLVEGMLVATTDAHMPTHPEQADNSVLSFQILKPYILSSLQVFLETFLLPP